RRRVSDRPVSRGAAMAVVPAARTGLQGVGKGVVVEHGAVEADAMADSVATGPVHRIAGAVAAGERDIEAQHHRRLTRLPGAAAYRIVRRIAYPANRARIAQLRVRCVARGVSIGNAVIAEGD